MIKLRKFVTNIIRTSLITSTIFLNGINNCNCNDLKIDLKSENVVINNTICSKSENEKTSEQKIPKQKISETVYVTKTGKCYHKSWCKCLRKSKIGINKSYALKYNYSACSKCY